MVVIGSGAGKSTATRRLADRLGVDWHDTDEEIERAEGRSISDIFVDGEAHFPRLERVEGPAASPHGLPGVLSLGGGAPMDWGPRGAWAHGRVPRRGHRRRRPPHRLRRQPAPKLLVNPRAQWTKMMNERRPTYERLATLRVDTAGRRPRAIVDDIVAWLEEQR